MERTPDPSHALIFTQHVPAPNLSILATLTLDQQFTFLHDLLLLQISDADGLLAAVDVVGAQDGMFVRTWGDMDAHLGMGSGEAWEESRGQEGAGSKSLEGREEWMVGTVVLHSSRAPVPVAVVKVEAFALEDECADAVLRRKSAGDGQERHRDSVCILG